MGPKQAFILLLSFFSCYLIFSLSFVFAYQIGELQNTGVKFIVEPVLRIVDELEPINCESSGYLTFHAYVENVPEFDIKGSEAFVEDLSMGETHNVTSALSCFPKSNLISNKEITCTLKLNELLSRLPTCPFEKTENRFYMALEISYGGRDVKISDEKGFVLTGQGTEPGLEINFHVSHPSYEVPEINCKTGSEIDVPVVIYNAETLFGDITWSFSVNETSYGGNMIECDKILTREGEGREDIYLCTLVISSMAFTQCEEGSGVWVWIRARTQDYDISGNFSTFLLSEELNLGLRVYEIEKLECQIINENGTCVPKEPQQNVTVKITGNVPARLKVFETRYNLGDQDITTTHCRKITHEKYECMAFITIDQLELPASKTERTTKSRDLTVFFDVKYLNYYTNISDSIEVEMEGVILDELLNTMNVLEEEKWFFEAMKDISKLLNVVYRIVDTLSKCCLLTEMVFQLTTGNVKEALNMFAQTYLWGPAKGWFAKALNALIGNGPALLGCIADKAIEGLEEEIKNLEKFEDGGITSPMEMPSLLSVFTQYYPECRAQNFWDQIKSSWMGWACAAVMFILIVATGGTAANICVFMQEAGINYILLAINLLLAAISVLLLLNTYNENLKAMALARERINLQVVATNTMTDYTETLSNTMETLAISLAANIAFLNLTYPQYDMVKLIFTSDRLGVLGNEDEICTNDMITIEYNFEKLNQTEGFVSKLSITPNNLGGSLLFGDLGGTYGPVDTDTLLGTNPTAIPPDPSEMYTFTLSYEKDTKKLDYNLYYVNQTCA